MSKRSYITCNTESQKNRWRLKVALKKFKRSWCDFRASGGKERDHAYQWARMLRALVVINQCLALLDDYKRHKVVKKTLDKINNKRQKYLQEYSNITEEYKKKNKQSSSFGYRITVPVYRKKVSG